MQVITVTHSLSRLAGGLFGAVSRLSQAVHAQGVCTRVFGLRDDQTDADLAAWSPLSPVPCACTGPARLGFSPALRKALAITVTADSVVHLHGLWKDTSRAVLNVSEQQRVPRIISPHGMLNAWALRQSPLRKRVATLLYESRNLRTAHCLHALNTAERQQIRDYGLRTPIAVIPNGVDLPDLSAPAAETQLAPGREVLLFLSRLHPKKGLMQLLTAWRAVAERNRRWLLVIAGPDYEGHRSELEAATQQLGLSAMVSFVGPQYGRDKHAWLRRADAFVLPSLGEAFPMAALEAMAYGLPLILSPQCNFPEAHQAQAALVADPDTDELTRELDRLLNMRDAERDAMGPRARRLVQQAYSWQQVGHAMVEVYQWMAGQRARPACVED